MAKRPYRVLSLITRLVVGVSILAGGIAVYTFLVKTKPVPAHSNRGSQAPRVLVMPARAVPVRRQWEGFGTARAMDSADVPARVTATVVSVPPEVQAGTMVERGRLLVQLDESDFAHAVEIATETIADLDAQLEQIEVELRSWTDRVKLARDQVELAQAEFERWARAQTREAAKQREVDLAKQALIAAIRDETAARTELDTLPTRRRGLQALKRRGEARLRQARTDLERCRIVSPLTGALQLVDVEVGESLSPGQRVARVVDLTRIEVRLRLPASARTSIRVGDGVTLHATGDELQLWEARVVRIAPEDDERTRTTGVFVEVERDALDPAGLAPGQFVRGVVSSSREEPRWVVPRRSLKGDRLLLVDGGRVVSRDVEVDFPLERRFRELGQPDEQWVVLGEPLAEGALVVLDPLPSLPDGLKVDAVIAGDGSVTARPSTSESLP